MPAIVSGDTNIHYQVRGDGPALLLIAGTGYPGATWGPDLVEPLAEDSTTIVYDHRGTGASPGTDGRYTTRLFAEDAAAVLRAVDAGPAHVVGHSMGGRVAQWLAFDHPGLVESLVLAASGPGHRWSDQQTTAGIPIPTVLRLVDLGYEGYIRERQRTTFFTEEFARNHPERVEWLGDAFWQNRPPLEDYLKHVVARQMHDATAILGELTKPAQVLAGQLDTHRGGTGSHVDQARFLAERLPRARLDLLPGLRHGFFWEAPALSVAALRRWITETHLLVGHP